MSFRKKMHSCFVFILTAVVMTTALTAAHAAAAVIYVDPDAADVGFEIYDGSDWCTAN